MLEHLQSLLKAEGFQWRGFADEDIELWLPPKECSYGNWDIFFDIPNGGILAVGILHTSTSGYWDKPTYPEFGYLDSDKILEYAKSVIAKVESIPILKMIKVEFTVEEAEIIKGVLEEAISDGFANDDNHPIVTALNKLIES